mmetsp:Transcript_40167/g.74894  ORF Transcript_40167/g.74894 Transcript_40167/m.74894 type:complete len:90 (-) Transcript_40167:66-335(-)
MLYHVDSQITPACLALQLAGEHNRPKQEASKSFESHVMSGIHLFGGHHLSLSHYDADGLENPKPATQSLARALTANSQPSTRGGSGDCE